MRDNGMTTISIINIITIINVKSTQSSAYEK